jgi:hypothetical protein
LIDGYNEEEIEIKAIYVNDQMWPSPILIPDLHNWGLIYGVDIVGIASSYGDGSYQG